MDNMQVYAMKKAGWKKLNDTIVRACKCTIGPEKAALKNKAVGMLEMLAACGMVDYSQHEKYLEMIKMIEIKADPAFLPHKQQRTENRPKKPEYPLLNNGSVIMESTLERMKAAGMILTMEEYQKMQGKTMEG